MNKLLINYIDNPTARTSDELQTVLNNHTAEPAAQQEFQAAFSIIEVTILLGLGFKVYNY